MKRRPSASASACRTEPFSSKTMTAYPAVWPVGPSPCPAVSCARSQARFLQRRDDQGDARVKPVLRAGWRACAHRGKERVTLICRAGGSGQRWHASIARRRSLSRNARVEALVQERDHIVQRNSGGMLRLVDKIRGQYRNGRGEETPRLVCGRGIDFRAAKSGAECRPQRLKAFLRADRILRKAQTHQRHALPRAVDWRRPVPRR